MAAILPEASFELDGYGFGGPLPATGATVVIEDVDFGDPDIETKDVARPRADGMAFGRDWRRGRSISLSLAVLTVYTVPAVAGMGGYGTATALAELGQLSRRWQADGVRTVPGAVSMLRYRLAGRQRVVYGRGRKLSAVTTQATLGRIPVTAEFACSDHLFYDDTQRTNLVNFIPPGAGGLTFPISFPWSTVTIGYSPGEVTVDGDVATWLTVVIKGPIAQPEVRCIGGWTIGLDYSIPNGRYVVIDPRPWSRGVRLDDGTNLAGALTRTSPRLSEIKIEPGLSEIVLTGRDETGSSNMLLAWRAAFTSP